MREPSTRAVVDRIRLVTGIVVSAAVLLGAVVLVLLLTMRS